MPFSTRIAQLSDADALSAVAEQTFALASPPDASVLALTTYIETQLQPAHFRHHLNSLTKRLRVLQCEGQIVGYSLLDSAPDPLDIAQAENLPELSRCYVLPAQHGAGAAQRLLDDTLAQVQGAVRLTVNEQNARAIRFYQRNGFCKVGEALFVCGPELHRDWVMVRE
ncbi:GNAT family N-acetyltransferase [Pseudomonas alkylphenolica]|uniref:GNAT family N-acetyltransferase n=1 Tax=Pseudomonas alkylphenolica TaxID=237609 RepID=A0A443ZJS8_9PSED|nr:GNAT family N-acetyltransferase [Pseudomonas alkylphenolica]RWU19141.1 GNAT family N-acetyltransferase [Pseudomonas alkylphenolica]